ncbi:ABC transporter substrate-binding protein [Streptomyces sp. NPDC006704]|uniref:ABC transporter substrate-binding protein n=1 Tax=Streptomyces sp. NPDC006704 TaxID=3364760 RepID=UPI0036CA6BBA
MAAAPLAAQGAPADDAGGGRKVLTVAVSQSVDSLSPFLAQRVISTSVHRLMYPYLTEYDPRDGHAIPGLAASWKVSPDKLTWTYTIRAGSRWSDGQPVTARDAAWTFEKMMTDRGAATATGSFVANFKKVTAPDPATLVVELARPQATMTALDVPIVPEHVWNKVADFTKFNNDRSFPVVGAGPFVLTGYKVDQYIRLRPNKGFWRGAPRFDELVFKYYKDNDAAVVALRKGEVSFVSGLTPAQTTALASAPGIKVNDAPGRRFLALATNPGARSRDGTRFGDGDPALLDARVRRALFAAVDRTMIVDKVFQGHAVEGQGYIPPRFGAYFWRPADGQRIAYDPARAAALLDAAGYPRGPDGARHGKDGGALGLRLLCHAVDPNDKAISKYLQEWWAALGVTLTVNCVDNVSDPWAAGEYDLALDGYSVSPDPDYVLSIHTCAALPATAAVSGRTDDFVCDRRFDELYAQQLAEYDTAKRADLVRRMESRLYDTGYINVMAYPNAVEAYRTDQIRSIMTMPEAGGNIYGQDGYWSWWSAVPGPGAVARRGAGPSAGAVLAVVAGAVALAGLGAWVALRRRAGADDRE